MNIIPILKCKDIKESLSFYTEVLDFTIKHPINLEKQPVVTLMNNAAELQLSVSDGVYGTAVNVLVDNVDKLFIKYLKRGLDTSKKEISAVHQSPINQAWGMREFYVTDANGNTLRFGHPII